MNNQPFDPRRVSQYHVEKTGLLREAAVFDDYIDQINDLAGLLSPGAIILAYNPEPVEMTEVIRSLADVRHALGTGGGLKFGLGNKVVVRFVTSYHALRVLSFDAAVFPLFFQWTPEFNALEVRLRRKSAA